MSAIRLATVVFAFAITTPLIPGRAEAGNDQPQPSGIEITVTAAKDKVPQVTPVEVTIQAVNRGGYYNISPHIHPFDKFKVEVLQGNRLASKTQFALFREERSGYLMPGKAHIKFRPSQRLEAKCYPNLIYDMTTPGEYTIRVGMDYVDRKDPPDSRSVGAVWSKPIKVKVVAIDSN